MPAQSHHSRSSSPNREQKPRFFEAELLPESAVDASEIGLTALSSRRYRRRSSLSTGGMLSRLAILFAVMYRIASAFTLNGRHAAYSTGSQTARALSTSLQMSDNVVEKRRSFVEQAGAAGIASAAVIAAAAVNSAVGMRQLSAPDDQKSFVYKDGGGAGRVGQVDEYGLPLVYDKDLIQLYWAKQGSALTQRWTEFLGYSVPFLTRVIAIVVAGGTEDLSKNGASLAKDARVIFEKLGPTYIKMGQMMSVRPDVLPQSALNELKILQDSVQPFDTPTAISMIEKELGGPLGMFFSEISDEPVAAASLAQVYKAKLINSDQFVAVKVQRPRILEVVSKDLYVLRRAAEVYQGLMDRFAPQQRTNYVALLNEWAVGFYTELDFKNEAANQQRLKELMTAEGVTGMYVPEVFHDLCTRRVMVSEWVDGKKLSDLESAELATLIPDAQEAFLTQLLQVGFFHSDPHPGNMLRMDVPRGDARIALLDFGLVASIKQSDMDTMVSAIIHLANNDYTSLVDDFIQLEILPKDCDRPKIIPLMDKALTPYVKGGGAQSYEEELKKIYGMDGSMSGTAGGFSAMTQDALTVLNDIPFSIPPYFALLARAIVTLEGVALTANPKYALILESYPFISRKLLKEDRPEIQRALQEVLYSRGGSGLQATRLSVLLNSALGIVAKSSGAMVDFDTIPEDGVSLTQSLKYLLGPSAASLRRLLIDEAVTAGDILIRQASRKAYSQILPRLPRPPFLGRFLPSPEDLRVPFFIPKQRLLASSLTAAPVAPIDLAAFTTSRPDFVKLAQSASPVFLTAKQLLDGAAPKLSREEELYAISLTDLAVQTLGADAGVVVNGNALLDPRAASRFLLSIASSGQLPGLGAILTSAQLRGISDRLRPLLGGTDAVPTGKGEGLTELVSGLGGLTAEEEVILQETSNSILLKIADKFIGRMQTLL